MSMKSIVTTVMVGCLAFAMSAVVGLAAQEPQEHQHPAVETTKSVSGMAAKEQAMMAEQAKMMADMQAADARLNGLVATMNNASGTDKVTATATVVTEMATQRRTMRDGMMKMEQDMMRHMMEHMQAGKDSMANCPMMKQMGDSKH